MQPSPYRTRSDAAPDTETRRPEANRPTTRSPAQGAGVVLAVLLVMALILLCCHYYFVRRHRVCDGEEGRQDRKTNTDVRPPAPSNKELPLPPTSEGLSEGPSEGPSRKLQRNSTATTLGGFPQRQGTSSSSSSSVRKREFTRIIRQSGFSLFAEPNEYNAVTSATFKLES